jgi:predicted TIM-barrel fold metal-dependent hydrolase
LQRIAESDFKQVLQVCEYASSKGLKICIDGSYGTSKMYTYDNMQLACFIADHIFETPIIIVHAGGYRVIEAMLLAADKKNVWLDTSFSLPYYQLSSIEQDFAYVIKKMDCHRVIFGSDHPYIQLQEALSSHLAFFEKYKFSDAQIEKILFTNALELYSE